MPSQAEAEFLIESSYPSFYWPLFFQQMGNASDSSYEHLLSEVVIKVTSDYHKWIMTISACILVGLSGIFPLLLFSKKSSFETKKSDGSQVDEDESLGKPIIPYELIFLLDSISQDVKFNQAVLFQG